MATTEHGPARRYAYLDLLRGLAAVAVLFVHYGFFFAVGTNEPTNPPLPAQWLLWPLYTYGGLAVPLFWAISGFVFAAAYKPGISLREFAVHRFARLYPLHFATLVAMAILQTISLCIFGTWQVYGNNDANHFAEQLAFASNWFTMAESFNAPIWSVSVEVLVYFVFLAYLKRGLTGTIPAIVLSIAGLAIEHFTYSKAGQCLCLFFAGVAIFHGRPRRRPRLLFFISVAVCLWVGAFCFALSRLGQSDRIGQSLTYLGCPALVLLFVSLDDVVPPPKAWAWLGLSTYSIYLLHMPLLVLLKMTVGAVPMPVFVGLVLALAVPCYRYFEAPAQRYLRARLTTSG